MPAAGIADAGERTDDVAALVPQGVPLALVAVVNLEPLGQGVHDRRADAVQTAGDLVPLSAEFAARVQDAEHDLEGRNAHFVVHLGRHAASVVGYGDAAVGMEDDLDPVAPARHCLIDGVVDDFKDEVVQSSLGGGADVHTGSFPDGFQSLEHLDLVLVIGFLDAVDVRQLSLRELFFRRFFRFRRIRDFFDFDFFVFAFFAIAWDLVLIVHYCLVFHARNGFRGFVYSLLHRPGAGFSRDLSRSPIYAALPLRGLYRDLSRILLLHRHGADLSRDLSRALFMHRNRCGGISFVWLGFC